MHDIADARIEIDELLREAIEAPSSVPLIAPPPRGLSARVRALALPATAALLALGLGAGLTRWLTGSTSLDAPSLARMMIALPPGQALEKGRFSPVALSPDGQLLVYAAAVGGGQTQLYCARSTNSRCVRCPRPRAR